MKKINLLDHLVNFVVVITGITVAFSLGNWKESRKQRDVERQYAESFLRDLKSDLNELDTLINHDSIQFKGLVRVFGYNDSTVEDDSLVWGLSQLGNFNSFDEHHTTFESLKSSGKFEEMWDLDMRIKILDNYNSSYGAVMEIEEYFQKNFDNNVLPYFINNMGFVGPVNRQEQVLELKFKNILGMQISFLQQKISHTKALRESTKKLIEEFDQLLSTY